MIRISNLHFRYRTASKVTLQGIEFDLPQGSFTGIAGPNGSGKTTLLKIIQGLLVPQKGDVLLNGKSVFKMRRIDVAKIIASVAQRLPVNFEFTAYQMVLLGRTPFLGAFKWESAKDKDAVEHAMERTNTLHFADRHLAELSGGEFQRVCIAMALASESEILLLDEPASFLDLKEKLRLSSLLHDLIRGGRTILCSSHDLPFLRELSSHALLLNAGIQLSFGFPDQVFSAENLKIAFEIDEPASAFRKVI